MSNSLEWLNYHHLFYFWAVTTEGGLVPAAKALRVSHPTVSAQVHALEDQLGEKLFEKVGRKLVLTDMGRVVQRYAGEIFSLGREMLSTVRGHPTGLPTRLDVGIVDGVPKLVVERLLRPALALPDALRLVCTEGSHEALLGGLASHVLDLVISDAPVPPGSRVRAYNHLLGECGIGFFARPDVARAAHGRFPERLNGTPLLLPLEQSPLRRLLEGWFHAHQLRPRVVGEFQDSALLKVFGANGLGVFPAPLAVERELVTQYGVRCLGRTSAVKERFYAVSVDRRLKHPAVVAIAQHARLDVFS